MPVELRVLLRAGLPERAPNGIRTRAAALKGRCPGPLDDGGFQAFRLVSQVGIEPTTRGLKVPCSATELLARFSRFDSTRCEGTGETRLLLAGAWYDGRRTGLRIARSQVPSTPRAR